MPSKSKVPERVSTSAGVLVVYQTTQYAVWVELEIWISVDRARI